MDVICLVRRSQLHDAKRSREVSSLELLNFDFFYFSFRLLELTRLGCRVHFDVVTSMNDDEKSSQFGRIKKFHEAVKWVQFCDKNF